MRKSLLKLAVLCVLALAPAKPGHATVVLFDWGFNVDGTNYWDISPSDNDGLAPGSLTALIDTSGFDFGTGLGDLTLTISGFGAHSMGLFLDHEIDEGINTFFNEFGATGGGGTAAGQSWEIDEPGFIFGDIFDNFLAGTLDNSNGVPMGLEDDVAMALGWGFTLGSSETAILDFFVSFTNNAPGFFLQHPDPSSNDSIYFWTDLRISTTVPEPGTLALLGLGLTGMSLVRKRQRRRQSTPV